MDIDTSKFKIDYYAVAKLLFSAPQEVSWPALVEMDRKSGWNIGRDSIAQAKQVVTEVYGYEIKTFEMQGKWGCNISKMRQNDAPDKDSYGSFVFTMIAYDTPEEAFIAAMVMANNFMWGKLPRHLLIVPEVDPGHGNMGEIEFLTGGDAL